MKQLVAQTLPALLALCLLGSLHGCGNGPAPLVPAVASDPDRARLTVAGREVEVELALTAPRRNRGLMHRQELAEDAGMLFVFPDSEPRTFWMRDTLISLDIIFLDDDGRVINVEAECPPMVERPGFHSLRPARYVLELRGGWCADHGLGPGDSIAIDPEVTARGV